MKIKIPKNLLAYFLVITSFAPFCSANTNTLQPGMVNPGHEAHPAWFKDSFLDIREDATEAKAEKKRVILYFYQDGCPYCKKLLKKNLAQADIVHTLQKNFDTIAINMWGDREVLDFKGKETTEKKFAGDLRVLFTPTLLFLDETHQVILRINGYYPPPKFLAALQYVAKHQEKKQSFRDYYAALQQKAKSVPQVTKAKATYNLHTMAQNHGPLLVMFDEENCEACQALHNDILQRPESQRWLRHFQVVRLDMWSATPLINPQGKATTATAWAHQLKLQYAPSLLFFDRTGKEVFRIEAYLKAFHIQSSMAYVAEQAYLKQPSFQRYIAARADALEAQGVVIELME